jgi:hypothetical protein
VARLVVFVDSPYHLTPAEAEDWLRDEAVALATVDGVRRGVLSRLASPSEQWSDHWGWMIELECEDPDGSQRAVRDQAWKLVLGDLRMLGMRPSVALVAASAELTRR